MAWVKKKFAKKPKQKKFFQKPKQKQRTNVVNRPISSLGLGFPKKVQMSHKYMGSVVLGSTAGSLATQVFSCNGMYDPDITNIGHQPLYYDQMTALYNHYTVIGSRIDVKFVPSSSFDGGLAVGGYINDDTTVTPGSFPAIIEQSLAKYSYLNYNSAVPPKITLNWSAKKYFGGSILANDLLQGQAGTNPNEQSYFTLFMQPLNGASTISIFCEVVITYIAIWKELKDIPQS